MISIANIAAFFEPLIATVATGIPDGICTVDNKLSKPFSLLSIGIPNTGKVVIEAATPAK